jgi:NAD(P)H-flavin reductase
VVTTLFRHVRLNPERTAVFVCGPEIMIRYVAMELSQRGVAPADIHVSMERNMKCGIGLCGHCQFGPMFICRDGPVYPYSRVASWMAKYEV